MARILVVDDEHSIRFLLSELLQKDNHEVVMAAGGEQACAHIREKPFELVITDLQMADVNGIDVLRQAKVSDHLTEVLILTGYGSITSAVEAMQLGAFEYLTKPIDLAEFRLKVQQALERRALRQQIEQQREEIKSHQELIEKDLKLAEQIQASLVPNSIATEKFEIAVRYSPMIGVGGDFSDIYFNGGEEVYLTIVDVTGHGISAALLVNRVCMEIRRLVREQLEPSMILFHLNDFIIDSFMGTGMFLTMFSIVINLHTGSLRYAGSAHPAAVLWHKNANDFEMLESQNQIIGFEKAAQNRFAQNKTIMQPGDKLILYTDGIIEAENRSKKPLGIQGLVNLFNPVIYLGANEIADNVMKGLKNYSPATQRDDVYLIVLGLR